MLTGADQVLVVLFFRKRRRKEITHVRLPYILPAIKTKEKGCIFHVREFFHPCGKRGWEGVSDSRARKDFVKKPETAKKKKKSLGVLFPLYKHVIGGQVKVTPAAAAATRSERKTFRKYLFCVYLEGGRIFLLFAPPNPNGTEEKGTRLLFLWFLQGRKLGKECT